jgi:hypothetical protein
MPSELSVISSGKSSQTRSGIDAKPFVEHACARALRDLVAVDRDGRAIELHREHLHHARLARRLGDERHVDVQDRRERSHQLGEDRGAARARDGERGGLEDAFGRLLLELGGDPVADDLEDGLGEGDVGERAAVHRREQAEPFAVAVAQRIRRVRIHSLAANRLVARNSSARPLATWRNSVPVTCSQGDPARAYSNGVSNLPSRIEAIVRTRVCVSSVKTATRPEAAPRLAITSRSRSAKSDGPDGLAAASATRCKVRRVRVPAGRSGGRHGRQCRQRIRAPDGPGSTFAFRIRRGYTPVTCDRAHRSHPLTPGAGGLPADTGAGATAIVATARDHHGPDRGGERSGTAVEPVGARAARAFARRPARRRPAARGRRSGETGLVMTPAQTAGFFARSSSWRCTGCGKIHVFAHVVPVVAASPCVCASIEFEPRLEADFSWGQTQRQIQLT